MPVQHPANADTEKQGVFKYGNGSLAGSHHDRQLQLPCLRIDCRYEAVLPVRKTLRPQAHRVDCRVGPQRFDKGISCPRRCHDLLGIERTRARQERCVQHAYDENRAQGDRSQ